MKRRYLKILPIDAVCKNIDVPVDRHNKLSMLARKRTGYIRLNLYYGSHSVNSIIEAAYIQGMTDMAEALVNNEGGE